MAKFGNILGPGQTNWITHTYHGENPNNPRDLSKQCAVDISAIGGQRFYSATDGVVRRTFTSGSGSYISITPSGATFQLLYVHTHKWRVKTGDSVKAGQWLGEAYPMSASHIHFGCKNLNGRAPHPCPMDYFSRDIIFNTRYKAIADIWFKGGKLNWALFKDLSYEKGTVMKIGDRVTFSADTNLRVGSGTNFNVKVVVKKGAVGTIIGGSRTANGYEWWDTSLLDNQGWVANVGGNRLKVTTKAVTRVDGTIPEPPKPVDPCKTQKTEIAKLEKELEDAKSSEAFAYDEVKKVKNKLESANLNISTQNDIIKNQEEDILLLEDKLKSLTEKVDELLDFKNKYEIEKEKNRKIQDKLDRGIERLTLGELIRGIFYKLRV